MTDNSTSESSPPAERVISRPAIVAAIFLGLHILPLLWRPNPLWGVDFLFYLPTPIQALFVLFAVLVFIPGFRQQVRAWVGYLPFALWGRGQRVWITCTLVLILAIAVFVLFSSARHFLGDGYILIRKLNAGDWQITFRAPLSFALIRALHNIGEAFWVTAENTYRIHSYASGILYILFARTVAAAIGTKTTEKSSVLAFLLTTGYMQLYFGYVEHYALYMPGVLLYLFLGLRVLENRTPVYVPAIVLGMLLALHFSLAVFGPSLLFLAYRAYRHRQGCTSRWKNRVNSVAALCCVPLSAALFMGLSGVGYETYLSRLDSRDLLPIFAEPGYHAQYRMFSIAHLLDFLNQQLLAAPAACMTFFLVRKKDLRNQPFLALCTIVPLAFTFIASPGIGAFRDWDIFSLPALPLTLYAATALLERIRGRELRFHVSFLVCGAAALHTLLWIGLNANAGASEARFVHLISRLSRHASVGGWITLGNFHRQQENPSAALDAYKRALDADPTNPNRWLSVGAILGRMGQTSDAIKHFKKAAELRPDHAVPYMNLGSTYSDVGQFDKAIEYTRKAIAIQPDLSTAHSNLGAIYIKTGQFDKAIVHLEKASELQPRDAAIYSNLGIVYNNVGRHANAIRALKIAVALRPDDAVAYGNLGVVYCDIGQFDEAIEYLKKALYHQPDYGRAYANLGYAYRNLREYRLAIEHFEKALELHAGAGDLQTHLYLGDTFYIMGKYEEAIPNYQQAIQLAPNHANAHLLLGMSYRALKRGDRARVHFEKTLELEPNHPQAAQISRWLRQIRE